MPANKLDLDVVPGGAPLQLEKSRQEESANSRPLHASLIPADTSDRAAI
jgi:hypothetical protein